MEKLFRLFIKWSMIFAVLPIAAMNPSQDLHISKKMRAKARENNLKAVLSPSNSYYAFEFVKASKESIPVVSPLSIPSVCSTPTEISEERSKAKESLNALRAGLIQAQIENQKLCEENQKLREILIQSKKRSSSLIDWENDFIPDWENDFISLYPQETERSLFSEKRSKLKKDLLSTEYRSNGQVNPNGLVDFDAAMSNNSEQDGNLDFLLFDTKGVEDLLENLPEQK
ncbi:MAG: hypothetical protein JO129_03425 [Candidatus Dependentiae bacterium]|nr:hypothetical protein [Candidatus Dependentiae bacterium]